MKSPVCRGIFLVLARLSLWIAFFPAQLLWSSEATNDLDLTIPKWSHFFNARGAVGYKDNVLLSQSQKEASPFFSTELELFVVRLPVDDIEFSFFTTANDIRYFTSKTVDKEQSVLSQAQLKRSFHDGWSSGLILQYLYQDQVLDTSTTDTNRSTKVLGNALALKAFVEKKFAQNLRLEFRPSATRQYFKLPLDSYWEYGGRLLLGRTYGTHSDLTLSYDFRRRSYDSRGQLDRAGNAIPDTSLKFYQQEIEISDDHVWDAKRRWRSISRLGLEKNDENGPGYFDYMKYRFSERLNYHREKWMINAETKLSYYDYRIQTVSATDLSLRKKLRVVLTARAERSLAKSLKAFGEYEYERSISNQSFDAYSVNTAQAGLDWEF